MCTIGYEEDPGAVIDQENQRLKHDIELLKGKLSKLNKEISSTQANYFGVIPFDSLKLTAKEGQTAKFQPENLEIEEDPIPTEPLRVFLEQSYQKKKLETSKSRCHNTTTQETFGENKDTINKEEEYQREIKKLREENEQLKAIINVKMSHQNVSFKQKTSVKDKKAPQTNWKEIRDSVFMIKEKLDQYKRRYQQTIKPYKRQSRSNSFALPKNKLAPVEGESKKTTYKIPEILKQYMEKRRTLSPYVSQKQCRICMDCLHKGLSTKNCKFHRRSKSKCSVISCYNA